MANNTYDPNPTWGGAFKQTNTISNTGSQIRWPAEPPPPPYPVSSGLIGAQQTAQSEPLKDRVLKLKVANIVKRAMKKAEIEIETELQALNQDKIARVDGVSVNYVFDDAHYRYEDSNRTYEAHDRSKYLRAMELKRGELEWKLGMEKQRIDHERFLAELSMHKPTLVRSKP